MDSNQIRDSFIRFYEDRGHLRIPSASLVPHGDPTLLFTSAGMVPFKPYFMGLAAPPAPRLTTVQKVFRTTDIDEVGDYNHLTFFEMLGNFSIGDYFKEEAIHWAWELLTTVFKLDGDRLWVSIFLDDDEAHGIWRSIGLPEARINRYDSAHNYWPPGDWDGIGPCGPNSEIFVDRGLQPDCDYCRRGECKPNLEPDCGRFNEVWNLVFMTLYQDEHGNRTPLPKKNIDTGSGLERVACVLQGKDTVYETDIFRPIIARVEQVAGVRYGLEDEAVNRAVRVVAEHTRAATFLITDGVMPSNEGRGYVLRRILRRAVYFLTQLTSAERGARGGDEATMLDRIAGAVIEKMSYAYPDLLERGDFVRRLLAAEEAKFRETLERGRVHLVAVLTGATARGLQQLSGADAFRLYDTFGYPLELTQEIAREYGYDVDLEGFERELAAQRERGRAAAKFEYEAARVEAYTDLKEVRTRFVGYDRTHGESRVSAIIGAQGVQERAIEGEPVEIVLAQTPFYAEGGGQAGDTGEIIGPQARIVVEDTQSPAEGLIVHRGHVASGTIAVGDAVTARVDPAARHASMRNHTATHLLHAALREVLGTHVRQAGSLVAPDRLRFDFTHIEATKPEELAAVQRLVNEKIRDDIEVHPHEESYDDAIAGGAMALFGEKYRAQVRVVDICGHGALTGDSRQQTTDNRDAAAAPPTTTDHRPSTNETCFSRELCGGTHVHRTGEIGAFVIESEGSVGSGVRRIEARTGALADAWVLDQQALVRRLASIVGAAPAEVEARVASMRTELEAERRRAQQLERQAGRAEVDQLLAAAEQIPIGSAEGASTGGRPQSSREGAAAAASSAPGAQPPTPQSTAAAATPATASLLVARVSADSVDAMREMVDLLRERLPGSAVVVLGAVIGDKPAFLAAVSPDLTKRVHAGNLVKQVAAITGGGGGGRPEMAQAGGRHPAQLEEALRAARALAREWLAG
ncbi:MAG TPA: alanine--tRNA ligase [Dehalococcoidia bacterium]|nr:alanine--tRNA ligase [Dehalococcoidia bacterium]